MILDKSLPKAKFLKNKINFIVVIDQKDRPRVIIALCGKRFVGKDYVAGVLKDIINLKGWKSEVQSISDETKRLFAEATPGITLLLPSYLEVFNLSIFELIFPSLNKKCSFTDFKSSIYFDFYS